MEIENEASKQDHTPNVSQPRSEIQVEAILEIPAATIQERSQSETVVPQSTEDQAIASIEVQPIQPNTALTEPPIRKKRSTSGKKMNDLLQATKKGSKPAKSGASKPKVKPAKKTTNQGENSKKGNKENPTVPALQLIAADNATVVPTPHAEGDQQSLTATVLKGPNSETISKPKKPKLKPLTSPNPSTDPKLAKKPSETASKDGSKPKKTKSSKPGSKSPKNDPKTVTPGKTNSAVNGSTPTKKKHTTKTAAAPESASFPPLIISFLPAPEPTLPAQESATSPPTIPVLPSETPIAAQSPITQSTAIPAGASVTPNPPKPKVMKDFVWQYYPPATKEANYLKDVLQSAKDRGLAVPRKGLGVDDTVLTASGVRVLGPLPGLAQRENRKAGNKETETGAAESSAAQSDPLLGKRHPNSGNHGVGGPKSHAASMMMSGGDGTRKILDVASSLEERLLKFGRLGEDDGIIKRRTHNNFDFYEQDDFIDDPDDPLVNQAMEIPSSRFDDFFCLRGNIESLKKHRKLSERIGEVKFRNRETKAKKTEEIKKQREELQIRSLKPKPGKATESGGGTEGGTGAEAQPKECAENVQAL